MGVTVVVVKESCQKLYTKGRYARIASQGQIPVSRVCGRSCCQLPPCHYTTLLHCSDLRVRTVGMALLCPNPSPISELLRLLAMIKCSIYSCQLICLQLETCLSRQFLLGKCLPELAWGLSCVGLISHWASGIILLLLLLGGAPLLKL